MKFIGKCLRKNCQNYDVEDDFEKGFCEKCVYDIYYKADVNWPPFCSICRCKCAKNDISNCQINCYKCHELLSENDKPFCEYTKLVYDCNVVCDVCISKDHNDPCFVCFSCSYKWDGNTEYHKGQIVMYQDTKYKCLQHHTSTENLSPLMCCDILWTDNKTAVDDQLLYESWRQSTYYDANTYVTVSNETFLCLQPHISTPSNQPQFSIALWKEIPSHTFI